MACVCVCVCDREVRLCMHFIVVFLSVFPNTPRSHVELTPKASLVMPEHVLT